MIPFVKSVGVLAWLVVLKRADKQKVNTHARNVESEYTCKICREQTCSAIGVHACYVTFFTI